MRICIVGASGYIGSKIVSYLKKKNHLIAVTKKKNIKNKIFLNGINKLIIGDIRNKSTISKIIKAKPEIIIYTISLNHHDSEKNINHSINVNVKPLFSLCKNLKKKECVMCTAMITTKPHARIPSFLEDQFW